MTELSPAAQAVLDAYFTHADLVNREVSDEELIAAVLRAAADQVVPQALCVYNPESIAIRSQLLAIADALENCD